MKKIIVTSLIFISVIFVSIFATLYTNSKLNKFSHNLDEINLLLKYENWQTAINKTENLKSKFENQEKKLQIFLNRENLKKIIQDLNKLKTAIQFKQKPKSTTQILKLQNTLKKIKEDEKPLIQNIL